MGKQTRSSSLYFVEVAIDESANGPTRQIFYRKATGSDSDMIEGANASLYVENVPCIYSSSEVAEIFSCFGPIAGCDELNGLEELRPCAPRSLIVRFEDENSVKQALEFDCYQGIRQPYIKGSLQSGVQSLFHLAIIVCTSY